MVLSVGTSLAEICSAYPTAGGTYYWAYALAGPRHRALAAWVTGDGCVTAFACVCAQAKPMQSHAMPCHTAQQTLTTIITAPVRLHRQAIHPTYHEPTLARLTFLQAGSTSLAWQQGPAQFSSHTSPFSQRHAPTSCHVTICVFGCCQSCTDTCCRTMLALTHWPAR